MVALVILHDCTDSRNWADPNWGNPNGGNPIRFVAAANE